MCGLLGAVGPGVNRLDERAIRAGLACLRHRGPDAEGVWRAPGAVLGHRRLSIIDLDPRANQPMQRGPLAVVFNGEIYNFRPLRRDLEARGHVFTTTSDTEVLLAGLLEHGQRFLDGVEGMFAFAVWDARDRSVWLVRDRFGEKPLFVLRERDRLLFASELGALDALAETPPEEDAAAIGLYFRFSYVPAPLAPLKGASQIEPGTCLRIGPDLSTRLERYYTVPGQAAAKPPPYREAVAGLCERLTGAVAGRLAAADVPVATLLSGGIDSSIVTVLADRTYGRTVRAYSLAFPDDPAFDESAHARAVAKRLPSVDHRLIPATVDDLLGFTDRIFSHLSEPLADASLVPTAYLLSHVEEKVVLGGDGADEVFAGYGAYPAMLLSARLPGLVKRLLMAWPRSTNPAAYSDARLRAAALFHANLDLDPVTEYLNWRTYSRAEDLAGLGLDLSGDARVTDALAGVRSGRLRDQQVVDIAFNLPNDMLRKVDIASMMFGIEGRLPYLDSGLVGFALGLPDAYRIKGAVRKRILRDAFADDLPQEVLTRGKMGFLMPIRAWFRKGPLRDRLEDLISSQSRFDRRPIRAAMAAHAEGRVDHSVLLWSLLVYLRWRARRSDRLLQAA